ncbi:RsmB/NOP family class I SAM-dependent RNA methyltransferase [Stakelama tenebrarum]|uniref:RsmB/NOP family class I SAM-dependent RNA methyltransferase n=1 Tax=Stakelama tenebrarum TaxID=2711215 RepID=A0A6G6Y6M5_9SPHN|nr:RsmB/NOP family class I SAM-dependent RNA methyltransferase [Sphingosinithalassobacter tenebrarum]QIG80559.1 RsmB/NOP family class I SAM-dependent RNA methyltransferase [Sphingosinithalassobacter tenebrarum]
MTPAARIQSAIELLDAIIVAARDGGAAADTIIARWFAGRRYAGSKDRRAIRELVYDVIRLCGERPETGRAAMLALVRERPELAEGFDGSGYGPAQIGEDEPVASAGVAPKWLIESLAASGLDDAQQAALLERAPLDIRVNRLKGEREHLIHELPDARPLEFAPDALRLPPDTRVDQAPHYRDGWFEVQDAGSQIVSLAAGAAPGMQVIDLCAGGGGKTLALAAAMGNHGNILACDVDRGRLSRLTPRAERAGVSIAETRLFDPGREHEALDGWADRADLVLIDAPCSGTGTWRRNPEARWRLTPQRLEKLTQTQAHLLSLGAGLVRPGGALVYIVCSLLDAEGADQIAAFHAAHPEWRIERPGLPIGDPRGEGVRLTPLSHSTDGFFVAMMRRP